MTILAGEAWKDRAKRERWTVAVEDVELRGNNRRRGSIGGASLQRVKLASVGRLRPRSWHGTRTFQADLTLDTHSADTRMLSPRRYSGSVRAKMRKSQEE